MKDWQTKVLCKCCDDVIWSKYSGEFVRCKCGSCAVDQTEYYSRWFGELFLMQTVENDKEST